MDSAVKFRENVQGFKSVGKGKRKLLAFTAGLCMCASSSKMSLGNVLRSYVICMSRKAVFVTFYGHLLLSFKL